MRRRLGSPCVLACLHPQPTVASSNAVQGQAHVRSMASTASVLQMQHPQQFTKTHGFGFVRHTGEKLAGTPKAEDLKHTPVDKGLGTSAEDPYTRTLPNLELRPPESTVLQDVTLGAPSMDEIATLSTRVGPMGYWLGGTHPRMVPYLTSLKSLGTAAMGSSRGVSSATRALLQEFADKRLPHLCQQPPQTAPAQATAAVQQLWSTQVAQFEATAQTMLFCKEAFERRLEQLTQQTVALLTSALGSAHAVTTSDGAAAEEVRTAVELLRRSTAAGRNEVLDDIASFVSSIALSQQHGSHAVLTKIVSAVASRLADPQTSAQIFKPESDDSARFLWESLLPDPSEIRGGGGDPPMMLMMTAPVALFLLLTAHHVSPFGSAVRATQSGVGASYVDKRGAARKVIADLVEEGKWMTQATVDALFRVGLRDDASALKYAVANQPFVDEAIRKVAREAAAVLSDLPGLRFALSRMTQRADEQSTAALAVARRVLASHGVELGKISPGGWDKQHVDVGTELLSHSVFRSALLSSFEGMQKMEVRMAEPRNKAILERAHRDCTSLWEEHKQRSLMERLTSPDRLQRTIQVLQAVLPHSSSVALPDCLKGDQQQQQQQQMSSSNSSKHGDAQGREATTARLACTAHCISPAALAVQTAHPKWVQSGVIPSAAGDVPAVDASTALRWSSRILLRLLYVPHAGAASIAAATRRRIGPIGLQPQQHNVPVEVGQVERYDNLLHKRYDWQGWYQRMVDIHNRNISIRCVLHELRTLTNQGTPLLDLQGERRLRIVAKDCVGMGILKLDSDKYEDQKDNFTHGAIRFSQLLADARKTQLGPEYVPTVEVKVRRPSGQSKLQFSVLDYERVERKSAELYIKYRDAKKKSFFVTPMDLWLDVRGLQVRKAAEVADVEGYTVDGLFDSLGGEGDTGSGAPGR